MSRSSMSVLFLALALLCATHGAHGRRLMQNSPMMPGSDVDENGCLPSAGYVWDADLQACVRPWEVLAADNDTDVMPGSDVDENGCLPSAGYVWDADLQACVRPWEVLAADNDTDVMPGSDVDENGCLPSAGYVWDADLQACVRPWEVLATDNDTDVMPGSDVDENGCLPSAGYVWDADLQACVRPWEVLAADNNDTDDASDTSSSKAALCPGGLAGAGLMGGWYPVADVADNTGALDAVNFILAALDQQSSDFELVVVCTQVVAGINYYISLEAAGGGASLIAQLYEPLPTDAENTEFVITSVVFGQ